MLYLGAHSDLFLHSRVPPCPELTSQHTDCKSCKLLVFAADKDAHNTQADSSSQHQEPPKAPPPPGKEQVEADSPFPDPQIAAAKPLDATATVELNVKLRSLVLSLCTDSVCVGIRMMERLQQYQQHAQLWQGRPQVNVHVAHEAYWLKLL